MGLTVAQVLERARNEIFEASGQGRPTYDVQSGSITDSSLTLTLEGRADNVPPDAIIEWDDTTMEMADVKSVADPVLTLFSRGYLETTAATHASGTKVIIDPAYPKIVLFNALKTVIGQLAGYGLYFEAFTSALSLSTIAPVALPSGAEDVVSVLYQDGSYWKPLSRSHYKVFYNYGPTVSSPVAVQFLGGIHGAATKITYKKEYTLPTVTTDDLDTLGIPTNLQSAMALGVAGWVLQGRDVPALESEYHKPDPANPAQPGIKANVGGLLWRAFERAIHTERSRILGRNPIEIVT